MKPTNNPQASLDRFHAPGDWGQDSVRLSPDELHHLMRVLRKQPGDLIEIFNGSGRRATVSIESVTKRDVVLKLDGEIRLQPVPSPTVTLAVAPPKGERLKWLIEKCTELGVDTFVPLRTQRSIVEPGDAKLHKLDQTVIAACKQSRRDRLMTITPVQELQDFLAAKPRRLVVCGDPVGGTAEALIAAHQEKVTLGTTLQDIAIIVGPEGGLTSAEVELLTQTGAITLSVGDNVLRVETAAVALAAVVLSLFRHRRV